MKKLFTNKLLSLTLVVLTSFLFLDGYANRYGTAQADPPPAPITAYLKLPAKKTANANRYFCIKPDTNCKSIKWIIPAGLDRLDPEIPIKDPNVAVLIGDTGTYTVQAYGALGDQATDIASCVVTIGTPPVPPTPPTPPNPPVPSAFAKVLQAAYDLDTDVDKAVSLAFLQSTYAGLVTLAPSWSDVKTNGQAVAKIKTVIEAPNVGLTANQLKNLRTAIASDFTKVFGTTASTPIDLSSLTAELTKVSNGLKGVK